VLWNGIANGAFQISHPIDQVLEDPDACVAIADLHLNDALGKGRTDFCDM